jgi:hypothetical protein
VRINSHWTCFGFLLRPTLVRIDRRKSKPRCCARVHLGVAGQCGITGSIGRDQPAHGVNGYGRRRVSSSGSVVAGVGRRASAGLSARVVEEARVAPAAGDARAVGGARRSSGTQPREGRAPALALAVDVVSGSRSYSRARPYGSLPSISGDRAVGTTTFVMQFRAFSDVSDDERHGRACSAISTCLGHRRPR